MPYDPDEPITESVIYKDRCDSAVDLIARGCDVVGTCNAENVSYESLALRRKLRRPRWVPLPSEIAEACDRIRDGWSPSERAARLRGFARGAGRSTFGVDAAGVHEYRSDGGVWSSVG